MTIVETLLVFAVIPLAIYGMVALVTLRDRFAKNPRYRPGQEWEFDPVWWTANPAGLHSSHSAASATDSAPRRTAKGGARGSW
ncbi:aa3-type cytochrome oxidase subunit CtaJ [Actinokineospora sp. 24-640]